jgi:eukaryotic-like serine/threonine-protein kinase
MSLADGSRIGHFEILELLGVGGMGEVYRARDTKLNRDVAIKVLPEVFAEDADRMARFEREARVLASLNHPNIASIYGLEEIADTSTHSKALVMELAGGPTLAGRVALGPVPIDEALPIVRQIAEALEYAHERGIIHRDLKPANVKLTSDGTVKVLDFGLAKALEPVGGGDRSLGPSLSQSPTFAAMGTQAGVILGTVAYMSPEQAKGKPVDRRADIWSFGVVLFEMLTGVALYTGETASEILAHVITKEPDWQQLPVQVPAPLRRLLRRCLTKDPRARLRDMGDARIELADALANLDAADAGQPILPMAQLDANRRKWLVWGLGALAVLGCGISAWLAYRLSRAPSPTVWRASIPAPAGNVFHLGTRQPGPVSISPDGRKLAYAAKSERGEASLWVHSLETGKAQLFGDTVSASYPFWSPDNRWIGFFAGGKLKKVEATGGAVLTLADAQFGKSGTWNRDDVILFAPNFSGPLYRISSSGGVTTPITRIETGSHRYPQFLPDGKHFLYFERKTGAGSGVWVGSLDGSTPKKVMESETAAYYANDYLLYVQNGTLMGKRFDLSRLETGSEVRAIAQNVETVAFRGVFSASEGGQLVYQPSAGQELGQLQWVDRKGTVLRKLGAPASIYDVTLAPNSRRVAVEILDPRFGTPDIWMFDTERGIGSLFAFGPSREEHPVWMPDGSGILFASNAKGHQDLYVKSISGGAAEETLLQTATDKTPLSWTADGRFVLYREQEELRALPLTSDRKPFSYMQGKLPTDPSASFSPDGRWVAYVSTDSGDWQVFVATFPRPTRRYQVSTSGASTTPRWRQDGKELYFIDDSERLIAVEIHRDNESLQLGASTPLFDTYGAVYFDTNDGQRFLLNAFPSRAGSEPLHLIVNWPELVRKQ